MLRLQTCTDLQLLEGVKTGTLRDVLWFTCHGAMAWLNWNLVEGSDSRIYEICEFEPCQEHKNKIVTRCP